MMNTTVEMLVTYADGYKVTFICSPLTVREFIHSRQFNHYKESHGQIEKVVEVPPQCAPGVER